MSAGMEYTLKPIGQQSVVWNVIDQLTQAMTMGKLRPGDKIPTETESSPRAYRSAETLCGRP